jgi:hypothetical protein
MKKVITILILAACLPLGLAAQPKFHAIVDYHYLLGLREHWPDYTVTRSDSKMHGNSIRLSLLYSVTDQVALGVGAGLDHYDYSEYAYSNTVPIFGLVHVAPLKSLPQAYAYGDLGYSPSGKNIEKGLLFDTGVGYKWMFHPHFGLNFQLGYNMKQFSYDVTNSSTQKTETERGYRHSLTFGVGLIF